MKTRVLGPAIAFVTALAGCVLEPSARGPAGEGGASVGDQPASCAELETESACLAAGCRYPRATLFPTLECSAGQETSVCTSYGGLALASPSALYRETEAGRVVLLLNSRYQAVEGFTPCEGIVASGDPCGCL